jgi:hypothetical protein
MTILTEFPTQEYFRHLPEDGLVEAETCSRHNIK